MQNDEVRNSPTSTSGVTVSRDPSEHGDATSHSEPDRAVISPGTTRNQLHVSEIGRRDPKGVGWLIRDVSLVVEPGQRLAIAGATGAGKTVLLRALALLDRLDAGSIHWRGHLLSGADVPSYRAEVIYLNQRPAIFAGSVEENLRYPYSLEVHRKKSFDRERIVEQLDRLGRHPTFLAKSGRELSGGEAQIVALLRATQLSAAILLLDEPTASLDLETARSIEKLVNDWFCAGQGARSVIWVSHNPEQLGRVADRCFFMRSGRLSAET